jgi:hypothetical protein
MALKSPDMRRNFRNLPPASTVRQPPSLGWMLLMAAALFALFLPIVGPLDDHHFAERTHNHDHIYLNGVPVAHHHAYEGSPQHPHQESAARFSQPGEYGGQEEILYLAPAAAGLTLAALNAPYHPAPESLRPPPPAAKENNPLERYAPGSGRASGESISPPLPPPIA